MVTSVLSVGFDRELAGPDLLAALVAQLLGVVAGERALEVAAEHGVDQVAVADAEDLDLGDLAVDGDQRNALLAGARQHIGLAGEAHLRLAIAHIDREVGGARQRLGRSTAGRRAA